MTDLTAYAQAIGASPEVVGWCETVFAAYCKKGLAHSVSEAEHIVDYLTSNAAPKRLRKMSYKQAKASADKWMKAQQKKGRNLIDSNDDIEVIHDFMDGTKIVKLLTKKAYQREGYMMRHCLGGYDPSNQDIYSYRDEKNDPHATFEVSRSGDEILQVKGKGNGSIHPKYINPILTFLKTIGLEVRPHEMINLGYKHIDDDYERIVNLFVDTRGKKAEIVKLFGNKYVAV